MTGMDHDQAREAAGLYALGALPADERALFEAHLVDLRRVPAVTSACFASVVNLLPFALPQIDPPPALRDRVLAAAGADRRPVAFLRSGPVRGPAARSCGGAWLSAAAMLVVAIGLGAYTVTLRQRVERAGGRVARRRRPTRSQRAAARVRHT